MAIFHTDTQISFSDYTKVNLIALRLLLVRQKASQFSVISYIIDKRGKFLFLCVCCAASGPPPLVCLGCHQSYCCWKTVSGITCGARYSGGPQTDWLITPLILPPLKPHLSIEETFYQASVGLLRV